MTIFQACVPSGCRVSGMTILPLTRPALSWMRGSPTAGGRRTPPRGLVGWQPALGSLARDRTRTAGVPEADLNVPVVHQGELLGAISVTMPRDEPLRPAGQQLVTDVASQAGLEALQNTAKYAHATQARICLQAQNGSLRFTVSNDGTGYDAQHIPMGSGLRNMADRLAALGGRFDVRSAPTQGTTITGDLPAIPSPTATIRS